MSQTILLDHHDRSQTGFRTGLLQSGVAFLQSRLSRRDGAGVARVATNRTGALQGTDALVCAPGGLPVRDRGAGHAESGIGAAEPVVMSFAEAGGRSLILPWQGYVPIGAYKLLLYVVPNELEGADYAADQLYSTTRSSAVNVRWDRRVLLT